MNAFDGAPLLARIGETADGRWVLIIGVLRETCRHLRQHPDLLQFDLPDGFYFAGTTEPAQVVGMALFAEEDSRKLMRRMDALLGKHRQQPTGKEEDGDSDCGP